MTSRLQRAAGCRIVRLVPWSGRTGGGLTRAGVPNRIEHMQHERHFVERPADEADYCGAIIAAPRNVE